MKKYIEVTPLELLAIVLGSAVGTGFLILWFSGYLYQYGM